MIPKNLRKRSLYGQTLQHESTRFANHLVIASRKQLFVRFLRKTVCPANQSRMMLCACSQSVSSVWKIAVEPVAGCLKANLHFMAAFRARKMKAKMKSICLNGNFQPTRKVRIGKSISEMKRGECLAGILLHLFI